MEQVSITTRRTFLFFLFFFFVTTRLVISLLCPPQTYIIYNSLWFCMAHYRHLVVYPPCRTITINDRVFWLPFQTSRFFPLFFFYFNKNSTVDREGTQNPDCIESKVYYVIFISRMLHKSNSSFLFQKGKERGQRERERKGNGQWMNDVTFQDVNHIRVGAVACNFQMSPLNFFPSSFILVV